MPMRLTLRTMLAYLDDILEPDDSEEIAKKIEESEFATGLLHRTRDCMRRLRLGAPPVAGRGMALDPNTVAEYLDNTLASERVPDFEKVCLESDMHLAEVAGCHQILTLVLGEPAEIDPASRERMYRLILQSAGSGVAADRVVPPPVSVPPVAAAADDHLQVRRARPEVPDYLRESKRSRVIPVLATLAVAAMLTLVVLLFFGPQDIRIRIANLIGGDRNAADDQTGSVDGKTGGAERDSVADKGNAASGSAAKRNAANDDVSNTGNANSAAPSKQPAAATGRGSAPGDRAALVPEAPSNGAIPEPGDDAEPAETGPEAATRQDGNGGPKLPDQAPAAVPDGSDEPATVPSTDSADPAAAVAANNTDQPDLAKPEREPIARPETAEEIGRYTSDNDVLLIFDATAKVWKRLPFKSTLATGDRLLALPGFRPSVTLSAGVTVQPVGPAVVVLDSVDEQGVPHITIDYGRVILLTVGKPKNQIHLNLGGREALVTFNNAQSTLAVDVRPTLVAGQDPATTPAIVNVDRLASSGTIVWKEGRDTFELTAGNDLPKWLSPDSLSLIEQRAAFGQGGLEHGLALTRSVTLALKELAQSRRMEVKTLAMRGLAHVGDFELLVRALDDEEQRTTWPTCIESLRAALGHGAATADEVRAAFEKKRGAEGAELYRMLWGYTAQQLKDGEDARLVDYLSHESLDFRVVSYWTLQTITNRGGDMFYHPQDSPQKRKQAVQKWKERLKDHKIVPTSAAVGPKPSVGPKPAVGAGPAAAS